MKDRIKKAVYKILKEDEYSRADDNYLIFKVVQELEPTLSGTTFMNVMFNLKFKAISFEEYPELKIEQAERARRKKEEKYYIEYSKYNFAK